MQSRFPSRDSPYLLPASEIRGINFLKLSPADITLWLLFILTQPAAPEKIPAFSLYKPDPPADHPGVDFPQNLKGAVLTAHRTFNRFGLHSVQLACKQDSVSSLIGDRLHSLVAMHA